MLIRKEINMSNKTAHCIPALRGSDLIDNGLDCVQRLYRLDPPYVHEEGEEGEIDVEYVVVSAVKNGMAHETLIFPANKKGEILSMLKLWGRWGTMSHLLTLDSFGYAMANFKGA